MASSSIPSSTAARPPSDAPDLTANYTAFLHNTSMTMLFLSPIMIALPPRKLDLYTFTLGGAFIASANHLTRERTGRGLLGQFTKPGFAKADRIGEGEMARGRILEEPIIVSPQPNTLHAKAREVLKGSEPVNSDWKAQRLREEQEKIEQGEGYGGMIVDQIWEVWNWGGKKAEGLKVEDERVLKERRIAEEFPRVGK